MPADRTHHLDRPVDPDPPGRTHLTEKLARWLSFTVFFGLAAMLLVAVGQPMFTDDTWWHLAHGSAYAQTGPWQSGDPLLYTSPGPPLPAAWLADVLLHATYRMGGFTALRLGHVALVAGILAGLWSLLARASRSHLLANLGTAIFICLSTYRLVQLRPHLFTILATLLLYRMLFAGKQPPSVRCVAASIVLLAVWANLHAAFVLGPVLIAAGLTALVANEAFKPTETRNFASTAIRRTAAALLLGCAATCLNPAGIQPHAAHLIAGDETPSLQRVGDEWAPIDLFSLPAVGSIPNPVAWLVIWALLAGVVAVLASNFRRHRSLGVQAFARIDLITLSLAVIAFIAMLNAVRFVWLSVFPLLFIATWLRSRATVSHARTAVRQWTAVVATAMLTAAFFLAGDWPTVSRGLPSDWQQYSRDYPAEKYHGHSVWLLRDAGLRGHLFAEYYMGGFLGFWLAPHMQTFINGSLNVSREAIDANLPIRQRRGGKPDESFLELLDRQQIDVFMGLRLPRASAGTRPWFHTTAHLEGAPGWIPAFRNLTSSLYLRNNARNRENLQRIADYYRAQKVPFDLAQGFDPAAVINDARAWAIQHGLVPNYYSTLIDALDDRSSPRRLRALNMLAETYCALGLYEKALEIDRDLIAAKPDALSPHRRLTWSLLRLGHYADARVAAQVLGALSAREVLSAQIVSVARATREAVGDEDLAGMIARLPVFTQAEARRIRAGMARPETRTH